MDLQPSNKLAYSVGFHASATSPSAQGRLYRTTCPGRKSSWGPSFPFFCLKTRLFQKEILKKSLFSFVVGPPSALGPWQPPGSPGGKDGPASAVFYLYRHQSLGLFPFLILGTFFIRHITHQWCALYTMWWKRLIIQLLVFFKQRKFFAESANQKTKPYYMMVLLIACASALSLQNRQSTVRSSTGSSTTNKKWNRRGKIISVESLKRWGIVRPSVKI